MQLVETMALVVFAGKLTRFCFASSSCFSCWAAKKLRTLIGCSRSSIARSPQVMFEKHRKDLGDNTLDELEEMCGEGGHFDAQYLPSEAGNLVGRFSSDSSKSRAREFLKGMTKLEWRDTCHLRCRWTPNTSILTTDCSGLGGSHTWSHTWLGFDCDSHGSPSGDADDGDGQGKDGARRGGQGGCGAGRRRPCMRHAGWR